jgi:hypothetical protein
MNMVVPVFSSDKNEGIPDVIFVSKHCYILLTNTLLETIVSPIINII